MGATNKKDVGVIFHEDATSFRVWAPFAVQVFVTGTFNNWSKTPMNSEGDGYWFVEVEEARPGQEYRFVIDTGHGELYKKDPRSLRVTSSDTDGNSVIVDTDFDWENDSYTPPPLNQRVIYEMHIGTFNRSDPSEPGTFLTAIEKLDYLVELGITTIELMPIATMSIDRSWWGYVSDFMYAVENRYGGRHAFLEFVKAAHKRGIGVMLDVIYNHLDSDRRTDLWQFDGWSQDGKGGIYFYNDWRSTTPWGETRFDYGREEVRQYILDNVRMWLQGCHVDGLRLDATGFIRTVYGSHNDPGQEIAEGWYLLQRINTIARKINPNAMIVAEDFAVNEYITKPVSESGAGFSAQWEVDVPWMFRCALEPVDDAGRNIYELSKGIERRYNGDAFQRVLYSDSHDSAANGGARLNEEIAPGNGDNIYAKRRLLLASAVTLTAPGIPMLLQGEEFLQGGAFNDWQALDWDRAEQFKGITLAHKHLIALRKNQYNDSRGLSGQGFAMLQVDDNNKVLAYHRYDQGGAGDDMVVVFNFTNRTQKDYSFHFPRPGVWKVRFDSDWKGYSPEFKGLTVDDVTVEGDSGTVTLAPYTVLIFSLNSVS